MVHLLSCPWLGLTFVLVWFQYYRKEHFHDDSLPPGKWTKRESKQNWASNLPRKHFLPTLNLQVFQRQVYLKSRADRSPTSASFSRGSSGYASPSLSTGYQTPRELKEEQWKLEAQVGKPGKAEMREMYKELGGRKARAKTKLGSSGIRDKGGWNEATSGW